MRFNLAYFGPEAQYHLRRDFFLALKYGLEDLGHDVALSGLQLDRGRINLVMGAYYLPPQSLRGLADSGATIVHVNTEVIANDLLNFNPQKTDFLGAYLPALRSGPCIWDVIADNMAEHARYGNNAHFFRWGWHPRLEEISLRDTPDFDFYFFGMVSRRREEIVQQLFRGGFTGVLDGACPYFVRNDRIARAGAVLNLVQDEKYRHVGSFRVCYLLNNRCPVVSEPEHDPAGYLRGTRVVPREGLGQALLALRDPAERRRLGEEGYAAFRETPMTRCLEELLDRSFASAGTPVAP